MSMWWSQNLKYLCLTRLWATTDFSWRLTYQLFKNSHCYEQSSFVKIHDSRSISAWIILFKCIIDFWVYSWTGIMLLQPKTVKHFQRVKVDEVVFSDERLKDNSYWAKVWQVFHICFWVFWSFIGLFSLIFSINSL